MPDVDRTTTQPGDGGTQTVAIPVPGDNAIAAIVELVSAAYKGSPPWVKFSMLAVGTIAILAVMGVAGFLAKDEPAAALVAFTMVVAAVVFMFWRLHSTVLRIPPSAGMQMYRRILPTTDIDAHTLSTLSRHVEEIRSQVLQHARAHESGRDLGDLDVRANVFLPDYTGVPEGYAYKLYMHPALRREMHHPPEWDVRFRPNEGATGVAFASGQQMTTPASDFELTARKKGSFHPDLKCIITTPIKSPDSVTLGVLNVDILRHVLDERVVRELATLIQGLVDPLGQALADCRKVVVTVSSHELEPA